MDRWKRRGGQSQRREEQKGEDQSRERVRRKKMQVRENVEKVAKHCVFPMICGSGGSKSRLPKAAGAEPCGQMRDEKLHDVWCRESHFQVINAQSAPCPEHFWKLTCRKSARRCGAKHTSKSKCTKHLMFGPLLEVEMLRKCTPLCAKHISKSKCTNHTEILEKCTPLWLDARFQVKMYKARHVQTTFGSWDVEKVHAVVVRSTFRSQNAQSTHSRSTFWSWYLVFVAGAGDSAPCEKEQKREGFVAGSTTTTTTLRYATLHYTTLHSTPLRSTPLRYTTLHYTTTTTTTITMTTTTITPTLHYTTLH